MDLVAHAFVPYAFLFVVAIAMPGWKSLTAAAVLGGSLLLWILQSAYNSTGNGLAVALGILLLMVAASGFVGGLVARAVTLAFGGYGLQRPALLLVVGVIAFLLPIAGFAGLHAKNERERSPSRACLASALKVEIAGTIYHVPTAPIFAVSTHRLGSEKNHFGVGTTLRDLCNEAEDSGGVVHSRALFFDFFGVEPRYDARTRDFCRRQTNSAIWVQDLCRSDASLRALNYPKEAAVHRGGEFGEGWSTPHPLNARARFLEAQAKAEAEGTPLSAERGGSFVLYSNKYVVFAADGSGAWLTPPGDPYVFECQRSGSANNIFCSTAYALRPGLQITYKFWSSLHDFEATAKGMDAKLRSMLAELSSAAH